MKEEYQNRCNCHDSISLEKEVGELKALIESLNNNEPFEHHGEYHGNTMTLYPVGISKWRMALEENQELKQELSSYKRLIKEWEKNAL